MPPRRSTCENCGRPITCLWSNEWVHDGPQGTYQCRDERTGMVLERRAMPMPYEPVAAGRAPVPAAEPEVHGRHRAGAPPAWPMPGGAA